MNSKSKKFFDYVLYAASSVFCLGLLGAGFYFYFYQTTIAVLLAIIGIIGWQTYKFAKMILILEDDLSDAIEALKEVEASMQNVLDIKLFFDTPEVQGVVQNVMNTVRMAKFELNKTTKKFVDRSKQKYITIVEDEEEAEASVVPQNFSPPSEQLMAMGEIPQAQRGNTSAFHDRGR